MNKTFSSRMTFMILLLICGLLLVACTQKTAPSAEPVPDEVPVEEAAAEDKAEEAEAEPVEAELPTEEPLPEIRTIMLWVSPQFDISQDNPAGKAMAEFISRFTAEHENINVNVRVKATSGESSALSTLAAAKNAAPDVVPSLILMSRSDMETSVQRGLIQPITTDIFSDTATWYNYARQSAFIDTEVYGIPVAGEAPVLVYRESKVGAELTDWDDILTRGMPIGFNPSSNTSYFADFIYRAMGGKMTDDQGLIALDQTKLTETLRFFLSGGQNGVFPPSITQIQDQTQNWQRFNDGTVNMIISQYSAYVHYAGKGIKAIALPTFSEESEYPLANTWNLVMTEDDPELQRIAIEFAEEMADTLYNDEWTLKAGFLPVRNTGHDAWEGSSQYPIMMAISEKASLVPGNAVLNKVTPIINNAVIQVIKNSYSPEGAAAEAISSLN